MTDYILKIAEDFTKFPAGRFKSDGKYSGEKFRDDLLVPALNAYDKVILWIDGVMGYGSSFLEEAFGGLVRGKIFTKDQLKQKLEIHFDDKTFESYETEIWEYINDAG